MRSNHSLFFLLNCYVFKWNFGVSIFFLIFLYLFYHERGFDWIYIYISEQYVWVVAEFFVVVVWCYQEDFDFSLSLTYVCLTAYFIYVLLYKVRVLVIFQTKLKKNVRLIRFKTKIMTMMSRWRHHIKSHHRNNKWVILHVIKERRFLLLIKFREKQNFYF